MSSPSRFSWRRANIDPAQANETPTTSNNDDSSTPGLISPPNGPGETRDRSFSFGSASYREPIRSFIHGSMRDRYTPVDSAQHARSVREDTAELASYLLSDQNHRRPPSFLNRPRSSSSRFSRDAPQVSSPAAVEDEVVSPAKDTEIIEEISEPPSPEPVEEEEDFDGAGPSILANMLRRSPPEDNLKDLDRQPPSELHIGAMSPGLRDYGNLHKKQDLHEHERENNMSESTPLLGVRPRQSIRLNGASLTSDLENQKIVDPPNSGFIHGLADVGHSLERHVSAFFRVVREPKCWDKRAIWQAAVVDPVACLPAVIVGLLLNILDALSYGMILFPLGNPIFSNLGPAGISIFYVSTIVSQLTYSMGSIFKGAVGSEMIEVVPFFHSMASTITNAVGHDEPDAVIATTIVAYAISSMMTGIVFFLMGYFKFGYIVGFIPRHILIGCIGGVGWFLVATGFEVSARIEGSLEYDLATLHKLINPDTIPLWATPLALAVVLVYLQKKIKSTYFLPCFILMIPIVFYIFVFSLDSLNPDSLRESGWIFEGAASDEPWWYFYTLYKFHLVRWDVLAETIPAMLALTFFGILHVPINVPALAMSAEEDNVDLNHELKLHGYSNFLSGLAGSIQNYLVYANTVMFMRSGANSRLAGFELAALTFGVLLVGPRLIGIIPVMMVGCLIFVLGFELLSEALWHPRKKLKTLEYLTVIAIILIMGIYDFVIGIGCGILIAFVTLVFQTSQVSAVRAGWSGDVVGSTVRRNPSQQNYLKKVGSQIHVIKLSGYLFFGTIVGVEEKIREIIADETFRQRPIRFLVVDLHHVAGCDYSAGEAFGTLSRLLKKKNIEFILSGVDDDSELCRSLRTVGIGEEAATVLPDLNSALESCENELLKTLYATQEDATKNPPTPASANLDVPGQQHADSASQGPFDMLASSPRRSHLWEAAMQAVNAGLTRQKKWAAFGEPLRLLLQIFSDLSDKNEDFWFRAVPFFAAKRYAAGDVLYRQGEPAEGFYLLESGIVRMEYDMPQGRLCESIVAGTTCGELPFFSETCRTATAVVERDAVVWLIDRTAWAKLQREEPDVAQELLRVGLKITSERMNAMTSHVLTLAY
ncbi:hypothetical protein PpBr36_00221 [Pyricularia pennisetigena]|uniref:hypothetical protein n=1 Tax=Pyricularia pennisetigena TaxID=1578925 RepID=UPI001152ECBD|nr:hypothetical protein PpBr36_00221 [Pyricularia pennisetigena]TLS28420.1 hypothetical protein PpBr36_00221 [Pyricularia pennisetigena]